MQQRLTQQQKSLDVRRDLVPKYAYAIPNEEAINTLASLSPIIDVGAGLGYWSWLVTKQGGVVHAIDPNPSHEVDPNADRSHTIHDSWNDDFQTARKQYPAFITVHEDDHTVLPHYPDYTLFLSWPDFDKDWSHEAIKRYQGDTLVYVGEGKGGCTGTQELHQQLDRDWIEVKTIDIPTWPHIHDRMSVYQRF